MHHIEEPQIAQELDERVLDYHRELCPASADYIQFMCADPARLDGRRYRIARYEDQLAHLVLQFWPTLVGSRFRDRLAHVSTGLKKLFCAVPERVFQMDATRISDYFRENPDFVRDMVLPGMKQVDGVVARGDFLDTEDGLKCIEINLGGNLGGFDGRIMANAFLRDPLFLQFCREYGHRLEFRDPVMLAARHILEDTRARIPLHDRELNICAYSADYSPALGMLYDQMLNEPYQRLLKALPGNWKGSFRTAEYRNLRHQDGALHLGSMRIHAAWEFTDTMVTPSVVFENFLRGRNTLYNGPAGMLLSNKFNIAALSENEHGTMFDEAERTLIQNHIPWTRKVKKGASSYRGEPIDLPAFIGARRESFVLKPVAEHSAKGVTVGRFSTTDTWATTLRKALDEGNWIVQETVTPRQLYYYHEGTCIPHAVNWGPFIFGGTFGGMFMRVQPAMFDKPISRGCGASEGIMFEVAE
ncbi:hypothetical protein SCOR_03635 [Sulfidibacter corallicola]|uniref:Circularly permuted type 2 ATP-grasp protein n=1 Tax=Sulfidibacter corallicola TaxID=2818388 RepID=A0A8A4TFQ1_SULCO|nr:hypothetical protein [Sulfidibacter corallicola]QTD48380.1 hypothetical protein J3U87_22600 [Sulfidibacter corallicola]